MSAMISFLIGLISGYLITYEFKKGDVIEAVMTIIIFILNIIRIAIM